MEALLLAAQQQQLRQLRHLKQLKRQAEMSAAVEAEWAVQKAGQRSKGLWLRLLLCGKTFKQIWPS